MNPLSTPCTVVIAAAALTGELCVPQPARMLVVVLHPDRASRLRSEHRFVADVLFANGVATLSIGLRTAEDESHPDTPPDAAELARRLRHVLVWLARHGATRQLPVGLMAVGTAVPGCVAAGQQPGLGALRTLVTLDGEPDLQPDAVATWCWPTLCLTGRNAPGHGHDGGCRIRTLPAPHRLVKLRLRTQPHADAGAFEAVACATTKWLDTVLACSSGQATATTAATTVVQTVAPIVAATSQAAAPQARTPSAQVLSIGAPRSATVQAVQRWHPAAEPTALIALTG